jgi:hypothetical protein
VAHKFWPFFIEGVPHDLKLLRTGRFQTLQGSVEIELHCQTQWA